MFIRKKHNQKGFIKIGTIIFIVLIFIILRIKWGIDITEPVQETLQKGTAVIKALVNGVKDFFLLIKDKLTNLL